MWYIGPLERVVFWEWYHIGGDMSDTPTLYERIGGEEGIQQMVESFYERVLQDELLLPFFQGTDMGKLRTMQLEFFTAALGGPIEYDDVSLSYAHQGKGIEPKHFTRFVEIMFETLSCLELTEEEVDRVIKRLNTYSGEIMGGTGLAG